tara:strand:- start:411 stop:620 length:210 start_codon:yes stop_codon:yes gene_type:complete
MLKKIGFIVSGLCGTAGLLIVINMVSNIRFLLRDDALSGNILWVIQSSLVSLTWIMLAVFVGMLAYKLK